MRLVPLYADGGCEVLGIGGADSAPVSRLVVSTPETRDVCNRPEIVGTTFTTLMRAGVARVLDSPALSTLLDGEPEQRVCVLHVLRGGLNFGLRDALTDALDLTRHASAFVSAQRSQVDGTWSVGEDAYRKLDLPPGAVVLCGDVVATGSTLAHSLDLLVAALETSGTAIRRFVFFTIGGPRAEEVLVGFDARVRAMNLNYRGTTCVYLEGRFVVAEDGTRMPLAQPGTDLLRKGALLAPAFEASQQDSRSFPLERCAVYDAGARAFDVGPYLEDVRGYWMGVEALAREGLTLADLLSIRWRRPENPSLDTADALAALARERIAALQ